MVSVSLAGAIAAILTPIDSFTLITRVLAFSPSKYQFTNLSRCTSPLSSSGRGFGEKTIPTPKPIPENTDDPSSEPITRQSTEASGSALLRDLRSRQAAERNQELLKIRDLRAADEALREAPASIPEKVASRMGKRMLPFVGVPLFGSTGTFVGFWYMATYKDMEFQPAVVASVSFGFLAVGLLGITYSLLSASWDDEREGSTLGLDEFSKNVDNLKDGLTRTRENALLRERMAGLSEEDILKAIEKSESK